MNVVCLLISNGLHARVYRRVFSQAELTLSYQQVSLGGQVSEFAASLCKMLRSEYRAGKFDCLVVRAPGEFIEAFDQCLDAQCRAILLGTIIQETGPFPNAKDLSVQLSDLLAHSSVQARLHAVRH